MKDFFNKKSTKLIWKMYVQKRGEGGGLWKAYDSVRRGGGGLKIAKKRVRTLWTAPYELRALKEKNEWFEYVRERDKTGARN